MVLNEIFDGFQADVQWRTQGPMELGAFRYGDHQYLIQMIHMSPGDMIHGPVSDQPITENTYFFAFAANPRGQGLTDKNINTGQSIPVFSIILQELYKFATRKNMDMLYFGCSASDRKRRALYQRMVNKYTNDTGWTSIGEYDAHYLDEQKHVWIVKREHSL